MRIKKNKNNKCTTSDCLKILNFSFFTLTAPIIHWLPLTAPIVGPRCGQQTTPSAVGQVFLFLETQKVHVTTHVTHVSSTFGTSASHEMLDRPLSRDIKQSSAVSREPTSPKPGKKFLAICRLILSSFPRNRQPSSRVVTGT